MIRIVKCVQPIVDGDFVPLINVTPRKDSHTVAHGVGVACVIKKASRGKQNGTGVKVEFAEVTAIGIGKQRDLGAKNNATVATTKDELALSEVSESEDAPSLVSSVSYGDVRNHCFIMSETGLLTP